MGLGFRTILRAPSASRESAFGVQKTILAMLSWVILATAAYAAPVHYRVLAQFPATTQQGDNRIGASTHGVVISPEGALYGVGALGYGGTVSGGAFYFVGIKTGLFAEVQGLGQYDGDVSGGVNGGGGASYPIYLPTLGLTGNNSLYGITYGGGPYATPINGLTPMGTVFTVSFPGQLNTLHTFYGSLVNDGAMPIGLVLGPDGNYYGITAEGGPSSVPGAQGVAFKLTPDGQETIIHTFVGTGGPAAPISFLMGADGNMYGMLPAGSRPDSSTTLQNDGFFKMAMDGKLTILYQLDAATDGAGAHNIIQAIDGNFYGTTVAGGANDCGTLFEITAGGQFSILHAFDDKGKLEGFSPGPLVTGTDGSLYGAAAYGSKNGLGAIFKFASDGVFTVLHAFDGTSSAGSAPTTILQNGPRSFYGVAGGSLSAEGPSGVYKMVVPVHDDLKGSGRASLLVSGPGSFTTAAISGAGADHSVTTAVASGYYPVATGDFDGDGVADIVWTSANHDLYIWFGGADGYTSKYVGTYPAGWSVVGAGDIDGDGMDDLLWMDAQTHQFAYWLMNGAVRSSYRIASITPGYYPATIGDFDGDGKADVLWTSASRDLYLWTSTGAGFISKYITTYPAGWNVVGRGDLDGDGNDDLLWMKSDGSRWGYWLMNGASVEKVVAADVPNELVGYSVAASSDYNGDGLSDIIWSNGRSAILWSNLDQCSVTTACTFDTSNAPMLISPGQMIFNSGLPPPGTGK